MEAILLALLNPYVGCMAFGLAGNIDRSSYRKPSNSLSYSCMVAVTGFLSAALNQALQV